MRLHTEQSYWWRSKFLSECVWIVTCVYARTYVSMLGDVIRACMARKILVQLSTDTHEFEKYSRGATKYTRVIRTRASSLNRAVPYHSKRLKISSKQISDAWKSQFLAFNLYMIAV